MKAKKISSILLSFAVLAPQLLAVAPAWSQVYENASNAGTSGVFAAPAGIGANQGLPQDLGLDAQDFSALGSGSLPQTDFNLQTNVQREAELNAGLTATTRSIAVHETQAGASESKVVANPEAAAQTPEQASELSPAAFKAQQNAPLFPSSNATQAAPRQTLVSRLSRLVQKGLSAGVLNRLFNSQAAQGQDEDETAPVVRRGFGTLKAFTHLRPLPTRLPEGVAIDPSPVVPDAASSGHSGAFVVPDTEIISQFVDIPLKADVENARSMEKALRKFIDENPQYGLKSSDLALAYAQPQRIAGQLPTWNISFRQRHQSGDSSLPVFGANITFVIQVKQGQPVIKNIHGRLFPNLTVNADQKVSEQEMLEKIRSRLRLGANETAPNISFLQRQIVYLERTGESKARGKRKTRKPKTNRAAQGGWHAVNIYRVEGIDPLVAVDIASGQVFIWDMRLGAAASAAKAPRTRPAKKKKGPLGKLIDIIFKALTPQSDHDLTNPPKLDPIALPFVTAKLSDGRTLVADEQGRVQVDLPEGKSIEVTAVLDSKRLSIVNKAGENIEVKATIVSGQNGAVIVFNPPAKVQPQKSPRRGKGRKTNGGKPGIIAPFSAKKDKKKEADPDEIALAQVTTYVAGYTFMDFNKTNGIGTNDDIWNSKFVINVNIDENCNAYMDPSDMSRNFFREGGGCVNTGTMPGVVFHESGHLTHYLVAGYAPGQAKDVLASALARSAKHIMPYVDGGLSEGIGDQFATWMEATPLVGEHFFNGPNPEGPYLRTTQNDYQFSSRDEVHNQGLAWMGVVGFEGSWHERLTKALGDAQKAGEIIKSLIFPHIYGYATAQDIPTALNVVYTAATSLTDAALRAAALETLVGAAKDHGMNIGPTQNNHKKKKKSAPKKKEVTEAFLPRPDALVMWPPIPTPTSAPGYAYA